jgi:DNA-binding transcriptional LysR family regulator
MAAPMLPMPMNAVSIESISTLKAGQSAGPRGVAEVRAAAKALYARRMEKNTAAADRIELMQTFVRIVEAGSLSAAAAQIGATQPTVSRRLQALERSLGVKLLQRSTHAMNLTEDGERCYERAKDMVANWNALQSDLRGTQEDPEGTLRVLVPHAFGQQQLLGPLASFLRSHPRVRVEWMLRDGTPNFIAENIDCAIQVGEVTDPSVVAIKLADVPRIVVAAPSVLGGSPVKGGLPVPDHVEALAALPWIALSMYYRNEITLTHSVTGASRAIGIRTQLTTDSLYALRTAALMGLGVCAASAWAVHDDIARGELVHLLPEWCAAPLPMYLVYPPARFYPVRLRRFLDAMREAMPETIGARGLLRP